MTKKTFEPKPDTLEFDLDQLIENMLTDFFANVGTGYWLNKVEYKGHGSPAMAIARGRPVTLYVHDDFGNIIRTVELTKEKFKDALIKWALYHLSEGDTDYDWMGVDVVVQLASLGEVIYG